MSFRTVFASLTTALVMVLAGGVTAQASQPIENFEVASSSTQAGGHPDLEMNLSLADPGQPEASKDLIFNFPQGIFGNPNAVTKCTSVDFALGECATESQLGYIMVRANYAGNPNFLLGTAPLFSMQSASSEETARFAFIAPVAQVPVNVRISVRTASDYGVRMTVSGISQTIPFSSTNIAVWGIPSSESHDEFRFLQGSPGEPAGCPAEATAGCASLFGSAPHHSTLLPTPLVDNPSRCTGEPLTVALDVKTYQDEDHPSHAESSYPATTGCEDQTFNPVFNAGLTTDRTDSASGLEMQMKADQFLGLANSPSSLRSASLLLPEGISINPDAADGQLACPDSLAGFGSDGPSNCPNTSKIGNFSIGSPALDGPLLGSLYIGEPRPGNQYRVFMIASGFGINAKLVAEVHPDPVTGQLRMNVTDLPQVPFEEFNLQLFSSDRGLVATPTQCRIYPTDAYFVPWNSALASQHSRPNLTLTSGPNGSNCPGQVRPFSPRLVAGMSTPVGGAFSDFHLKLDRDDGDQFLGDLNFRMPPGFTGDLRGISYCSDGSIAAAAQALGRTEQASPNCPAASQIGTTNVSAGPGSHPFHAIGKMYLAGPFKGAPLSLVAITPALAGPYDYGVVVVRVALHVDPQTAQVSAVSDTVPSIIGGIPIRMRSIQVNIDRPRFTINPTNCTPSSIDSQGIGDQGTVTDFSSYFHAVNCSSLPFKPKMTFRQVGRRSTTRAKDPELKIDLRTRPGDANIKSLAVTLSSAFAIDQRHLGNICSEKELAATQCAGRSAIGRATTETPLLDKPLSGPVFAVSGSGGLPRLAFILNGQVTLVPRADTETIAGGRLQTTVPVVPDAPIGHFRLTVFGGKRGYLVNTRDICAKRPLIRVAYTAQNAKTRTEAIKLKAACSSRTATHKRH
jgi:hypothetical protein